MMSVRKSNQLIRVQDAARDNNQGMNEGLLCGIYSVGFRLEGGEDGTWVCGSGYFGPPGD